MQYEGDPKDHTQKTKKRLKIRLIKHLNTESDPLPTHGVSKGNQKNIEKKQPGIMSEWFFVVSIIVAIFTILSGPAIMLEAGLSFSDPNDYISGNTSDYNSQNIDILDAKMNVGSAEFAAGGGDINLVDGMALSSDNGIGGTSVVGGSNKNSGKISIYEVREGDTLSQIAEMFDVSINTIRWANDFDGAIQPGQKLIILPVSGLTHVVKHGGTIQDVADIYDADVREIALFNGLDESVQLEPGQEIIVPHVDHNPSQLNESDSSSGNSSVQYVSAPTNTVAGGYYVNPVPGARVTQGLHGYNGIDLGAGYGTPILAAAAGKVITSKQGGWNGGYGNMIVISHPNGTQTLYSHLSSNSVYVGQTVSAGEVIGAMGSTGQSTGNHLHFEVRGASNPLRSCSVGSVCYID
jgi:murein DD-endopeptidase MepM/ murein hydrolase activator NlpD